MLPGLSASDTRFTADKVEIAHHKPIVKLADPLVDAILAGLVKIWYWPAFHCLSFGCGGYMMQKRTRTCLVVRICWQSGADCTDYRGQQSLAVSVWVSARRTSSALILCPQRILTPERKSTCSWLTLPQTACTNFHLVRSFFGNIPHCHLVHQWKGCLVWVVRYWLPG